MGELRYPERLNCAAELLDATVNAGNGERVALRFPGGRWTYRELLEHANRIAQVLTKDLGVVPGNRVLLRGPNNPMMAACWFAVLKAGGVVVCTMPLLRARELGYLIEKAKIGLALCDARVLQELQNAASGASSLRRIVEFGTDAAGSLDTLARPKPATFTNVATVADDVALIAFTSGTTGQAKGTMHFHRDQIGRAHV